MNIVVLNGFEEYDEEVALAGSLSLESGDFAIRHYVDLCSVVSGGNNGNNNDCPDDGVYDISTSFPLPGSGGKFSLSLSLPFLVWGSLSLSF